MIVKDESHIIYETLMDLISLINFQYVIICDTGSSDNTIELCELFIEKNKLIGKVIKTEWKDFATNRNIALKESKKMADYSLIFDADDKIIGDIKIPSDLSGSDQYLFRFGYNLNYYRPLLVNNKKNFKWHGILHEYISCEGNIQTITFEGEYFILSGRTGSRNKCENKYIKDALLLEREIYSINQDHYLFGRYNYYCAQSYRDSRNMDKAIEYYNKCLNTKISFSEKYVCCLELFELTDNIEYLFKCDIYDNIRIEHVCKLMKYFYNNKNYNMINMLYNKHQHYLYNYHFNFNKLLFDKNNYQSLTLDYYNSIAAYYVGEYNSGFISSKKCIFNNIHLDLSLGNLKFYEEKCNIANIKKSKNPVDFKNIKILFCSQKYFHPWNYLDLETIALGGSEKALGYLSYNLVKYYKNSNIHVYGDDLKPCEIYENNSCLKYINDVNELYNYYDIIVISRNCEFFKLSLECSQLYVWQHDATLSNSYYYDLNNTNKLINLTEWHKNNTLNTYHVFKEFNIYIINNGINLELLKVGNKQKNSFIYSGCFYKALNNVLNLWGDISKNFKDSILYICGYNDFPSQFQEKINKYNNIIYKGKLKTGDLYELISNVEYWLYPNNFTETSCITAMEMMASGVICLYYPVGGLVNTMNNNGIILERGTEIDQIKQLNEKSKTKIREQAIEYIKDFTWENRVKEWDILFNNENNNEPHGVE